MPAGASFQWYGTATAIPASRAYDGPGWGACPPSLRRTLRASTSFVLALVRSGRARPAAVPVMP